eukprot:TCONS_00027458-protein
MVDLRILISTHMVEISARFACMRGNDIVKEIFRKEFRIYPATFDLDVDIVNRPLERQNANLRERIAIHKRVAVALWRLATGNQYRVVAKVFGVGITSVYHILIESCVVLTLLVPHFIKFPFSTDECAETVTKFRHHTDCKLPQIVGCIDCTHTRITKSIGEGSVDYVNLKHVYSGNTQAVVCEGTNLSMFALASQDVCMMHDEFYA